MTPDVRVFEDVEELSRAALAEVLRRADRAVRERGGFDIALAGGSTPRRLYSLLAAPAADTGPEALPWDAVHVFFGDERHVPPDHPDSNYGMANEALLSRVPIPPENVHRIPAEDPDARRAAAAYEETLRQHFRLGARELPRFDLVLLGMGPDGHTASLFPGTAALGETERLVVGQWVSQLETWRITLAPRVLNSAAAVIFVVAGEDKAGTLQEVLRGPYEPTRLPSQLIRPTNGDLVWLVDRSAARLLT